MKTCNGPSHLLLQLIYITLFPVFEAQKVKVVPQVTGYLRNDVTLPCQLIQGQKHTNITQVEWSLQQPEVTETKKVTIVVFSSQFGLNISNSTLKNRVTLSEHSLIIKDVEMGDAGSYTCSIATFPSGSFEGTTKLVVREKMSLSAGIVSAIVTAVVLLLVIMAAVAYLVFIRGCHSSVRHRVITDTASPVRDVTRPSVIIKEDVVYADVKLKPSRHAPPLFSGNHRDTAHADDVTYSEVVVSHHQPKSNTEYAYV